MIKTLVKLVGTFGILGVAGLVVLLVLGYIVYRVLKYKFGGLMAKATLASQPTEIHLVRERAPSWDDREAVAETVDRLRALGFRALGTYGVEEIRDLQFVALGHPEEGCGAAVYENDEGHWVDYFVRLHDDDSWLTVSNTENKVGEKLPPQFEKHYLKPGSSVDAMWKTFHKRLKHRLVAPVTPDSYVAEYQRGYREEIQARFDAAGIEPDGTFGEIEETLDRDPEQDAAAAPIFEAIGARDLDRLREVLAPGPALGSTLEGRDDDGKTPLMAAILTGDLQFVQAMLDAGADPSATAPGSPKTPFMKPPSMAEMAEDIDDPEAKRFMKGFGQVMGAFGAGNLGEGGTITPVLLGLWMEDLYIVAALIESGATVEGPPETAPKPLGFAIGRGDLDAARWLLQSGADPTAPDDDDERPLDIAIEARDIEAVQLLIEFGADVDAKDEDGDTPIVLAAMMGDADIFEVLAPHAKKNLRKARKALQESADVEESNTGADNLVRAAGDCADPRVRRLLAQGVPVDAVTDEYSPTALMMAAQMGNVRMLRALLDAGADPNFRTDDETPLHRAAQPQFMDPRVQPQIIQMLLDAGANLEALDDEVRAQVIRGLERGGGVLPAAV